MISLILLFILPFSTVYHDSHNDTILQDNFGNVNLNGTDQYVISNALSRGGHVIFDQGHYKINSYPVLPSNLIWEGQGNNTRIERNYTLNVLAYLSPLNYNLQIKNISFDGENQTYHNNHAELDLEGKNVYLQNVNIFNFGYIGLALENSGILNNVNIKGDNKTSYICLHIGSNSSLVKISQSSFIGCNNELYLSGRGVMTNSYVEGHVLVQSGGMIVLVGKSWGLSTNVINATVLNNQGCIELWSGKNIITSNIFIKCNPDYYYDRTLPIQQITNNMDG